MPRRHSAFRQHMVRSGRKTFWFSALHTKTVITAASTATLITSLNAVALSLRPFTIVRTRGFVGIVSDQLAGVEDQAITYGEIVVTDQAVAIGVTAVPTPVTDSQSSWHVLEAMADRFNFVTGVGFQQSVVNRVVIDSKAMRKVEEGQDLISVAETSGASNGVVVFAYSRTLIKLH